MNDAFADWEYRSQKSIVIPYNSKQPAFPADILVQLYLRTAQDELLDTVLAGMGFTHHLNGFVSYMNSHALCICGVLPQLSDDKIEIAGYGWICEMEGVDGARKAAFGFSYFKNVWGTRHTRDFSWLLLAWWFKELRIDTLFGMTLKSNRLARNHSKTFGFRHIADIPRLFFRRQQLEDASLVLLLKDDFLPLYDRWRETRHGR